MTPDPAYLYASRTHSEALASLTSGIVDNRGFLALMAQPGMGKTTLLYQLLDDLRDHGRTVLLSQTQCNSREFIEYILQELGVDIKGMGLVAMHGMLNEILFEELLAGKRFVLIVDEAQNLDDGVLETVRMLSNFETHNTKLMQIILAGQPPLAAKLAQPKLSQLRQRVAVMSHLEPFTAEETGRYIEHRLKVAGYRGGQLFDRASIGAIARHSDGIPRNINSICYHALDLSAARGVRGVGVEIVQQAVARLDLERFISEPEKHEAPAAAFAAAASASASSTPAPVWEHHSVPEAAPIKQTLPADAFLSYGAGKRVTEPKWSARLGVLAIIVLSGTLVLALLGRSESRHGIAPGAVAATSVPATLPIPAGQSQNTALNYDAAPLDTGSGQVLTVVAGPRQTLQDICLRYAGHFDSALSQEILILNPDLKNPDQLEEGQLIRIPLPPGAMKKTNDTAEDAASGKTESTGNIFTRFTTMLRARK